MRVAFITHYAEMFGANRSLLNLIDGLRPYGVESFVVTPDLGDFTRALEERGIAFRQLAIQEWMVTPTATRTRWERLYINLRVLPHLLSQLRKWRIQIVYSNSSVFAAGQVAALLLGIPHIWHFREFGELHYGMRLDWGRRSFDFLVSKSDARIAVSNCIRERLLHAQLDGKVHVIYNGVATEAKFDQLSREAERREWTHQAFTFLMVGLFHPAKGQEQAIRAFARVAKQFPDTRLLLVGTADTPYADTCRDLVARLGLGDKVVFPGWVSDPFPLYLKANALLMCSQYEAMGRVTAEAMAACLPVIGTDRDGTLELVDHERTGLLYHDGEEGLAHCMVRFIEDPIWARKLGQQGWQVARSKFTSELYARQVYDVLQRVLK
jgi:glycosyltransferase involved in cell wall biosynthesis